MPRRKQPKPSPGQQPRKPPTPAQLRARAAFGQRARERAAAAAALRKPAGSASSPQPQRNPPASNLRPLSGAPAYQSVNGTSIDSSEAYLLQGYLPDVVAAGSEPPTEQPAEGEQQEAVGESQSSVSALHAIWQSVAGTADDPYRQPGGPGWSTGTAGAGADGKATPAQRKLERDHAELEDAAGQWYDTGALLFSWLMWAIVGKDLGPDDQQAHSVADPLIRIALRHFDPLRKASPDAADAIASATAFAIYMQAIWPYWMERRKERASIRQQQRNERQRDRGAYAVPIEHSPEPAPATARAAAPVDNGRASSGARQAAGRATGLRTESADHGAGAYEQNGLYSGSAGLAPEDAFTESTGFEF